MSLPTNGNPERPMPVSIGIVARKCSHELTLSPGQNAE
jgi:hypothetical protein